VITHDTHTKFVNNRYLNTKMGTYLAEPTIMFFVGPPRTCVFIHILELLIEYFVLLKFHVAATVLFMLCNVAATVLFMLYNVSVGIGYLLYVHLTPIYITIHYYHMCIFSSYIRNRWRTSIKTSKTYILNAQIVPLE